jgi:hypothetical protein
MKFNITALLFALFIILPSCSNKPSTKDAAGPKIITVDRNAESNQLSDLFGEVQLIPLETTDNSLMADIRLAKVRNDTLFFFSRKEYSLFVFNAKGEFLNRIGKVGQGPGEYWLIHDFDFCPKRNSVEMLSPAGSIFSYRMNGDFIEKRPLGDGVYSFQDFEYLNAGSIVLWTFVETGLNALRIIDSESAEIISSYKKAHSGLDTFKPFHKANGVTYFSNNYDHCTYQVTLNGLVPEYTWDFGEDTYFIEKKNYTGLHENYKAEQKDKMASLIDGTIPYVLAERRESLDYYYLWIYEKRKTRKNFFVHKESRKSYNFVSDDDHIHLNPIYIGDNYILSEIQYEDIPHYLGSVLLSDKDKEILRKVTVDENSVIAKLYFKESN